MGGGVDMDYEEHLENYENWRRFFAALGRQRSIVMADTPKDKNESNFVKEETDRIIEDVARGTLYTSDKKFAVDVTEHRQNYVVQRPFNDDLWHRIKSWESQAIREIALDFMDSGSDPEVLVAPPIIGRISKNYGMQGVSKFYKLNFDKYTQCPTRTRFFHLDPKKVLFRAITELEEDDG